MKLIKGSFIYSIDKDNIEIKENQYLLIRDGKSEEFYKEIPSRLKNIQIEDYGDNIIIPGLIDLHIHAPQYAFRGMGMDMQLLDWLNTYAFKEEGKYRDLEYAKKQYSKFVSDVKNSATTRLSIFPSYVYISWSIILVYDWILLKKVQLKTSAIKIANPVFNKSFSFTFITSP